MARGFVRPPLVFLIEISTEEVNLNRKDDSVFENSAMNTSVVS